jgi:hypothetical protein
MEARRFISRLTLCAMDNAKDTGEICGIPLCASNEVEMAAALSGSAATSPYVVSTSFEMRSPNFGFAVNEQSQKHPFGTTHTGSIYMKPSLLVCPWVVYQVNVDMTLRNHASSAPYLSRVVVSVESHHL